jgi:hypothetical protein
MKNQEKKTHTHTQRIDGTRAYEFLGTIILSITFTR